MNRLFVTVLAFLVVSMMAVAQPQDKSTGPFGFERGMTREQIIKLVGGQPGKKNPFVLRTDKSPIPNDHFESFLLFISPTQGLLKIVAVGKDTNTSDTGFELRGEFNTIHTGITAKYGVAKNNFDHCNGGTGCSSPEVWMLGLLEKNATLASFWENNPPKNGVTAISLEAKPLALNKGYCSLAYEFEGWNAFVDAQTAQQNQSF